MAPREDDDTNPPARPRPQVGVLPIGAKRARGRSRQGREAAQRTLAGEGRAPTLGAREDDDTNPEDDDELSALRPSQPAPGQEGVVGARLEQLDEDAVVGGAVADCGDTAAGLGD